MRYLFLLPALLLAANPAAAQDALAAARPHSPLAAHAIPREVAETLPAAMPDTVAAIHRLFAARRHQSAVVISATVGAGLLGLLVAENTRHSSTIDATPILATGISLLSIPATITEIGYYQHFTRRKEQRAIAAFEAHKLPERIKRHLQPAYFEAAHSDYITN
ncbi:MAG: hypothetical protein ACRYFZ_22105 [Janthinobacterium lividum]